VRRLPSCAERASICEGEGAIDFRSRLCSLTRQRTRVYLLISKRIRSFARRASERASEGRQAQASFPGKGRRKGAKSFATLLLRPLIEFSAAFHQSRERDTRWEGGWFLQANFSAGVVLMVGGLLFFRRFQLHSPFSAPLLTAPPRVNNRYSDLPARGVEGGEGEQQLGLVFFPSCSVLRHHLLLACAREDRQRH